MATFLNLLSSEEQEDNGASLGSGSLQTEQYENQLIEQQTPVDEGHLAGSVDLDDDSEQFYTPFSALANKKTRIDYAAMMGDKPSKKRRKKKKAVRAPTGAMGMKIASPPPLRRTLSAPAKSSAKNARHRNESSLSQSKKKAKHDTTLPKEKRKRGISLSKEKRKRVVSQSPLSSNKKQEQRDSSTLKFKSLSKKSTQLPPLHNRQKRVQAKLCFAHAEKKKKKKKTKYLFDDPADELVLSLSLSEDEEEIVGDCDSDDYSYLAFKAEVVPSLLSNEDLSEAELELRTQQLWKMRGGL